MNRNSVLLFWALGAAGLLAGCASSQFSRIDANRAVYDTWPLEVRQAVLDGKVEPGMTPEMVEVAWGKPTEIENRAANDETIWVYRTGDDTGGGAYPGGGMGGSGTTIGVGTGGVMTSTNIGMGAGGIGMGGMGGMGGPVMPASQPVVEKEVVFRSGVVFRADAP